MRPEHRAFVARKMIDWTIRQAEPSLKAMCLACCDRRALAYQLGGINDVKHQELMLRSGLRLGFIMPLGQVKPAGNA